VTVGLYLHLAVSVVHEIKDALGIYCFRSANLCVILLSKKTAIFQLVLTLFLAAADDRITRKEA